MSKRARESDFDHACAAFERAPLYVHLRDLYARQGELLYELKMAEIKHAPELAKLKQAYTPLARALRDARLAVEDTPEFRDLERLGAAPDLLKRRFPEL